MDYWIKNPGRWKRIFAEYIRMKSEITREDAEQYASVMSVEEWRGISPISAVNEEMTYF